MTVFKKPRLRMLQIGPPVLDIRSARPPRRDYEDVYQSRLWRVLVDRLKRERGNRCDRCGATGCRIIGDHRIELRDGGEPFTASNVELMCHACHGAKSAAARRARLNP